MCYYATTDFACGDWKWGNMKLRCPRQHRMGETCGAKLVHHESVTKSKDNCRLCDERMVKERRLQKEKDNIARWSREGNKFSASIEKAQRESATLEQTIRELWAKRPSIAMKVNGQASGLGTSQTNSASRHPPTSYSAGSEGGYASGSVSYASHPVAGYASSPNGGQTNRHSGQSASGSVSGPSGRHAGPHNNVPAAAAPSRHAVSYSGGYSTRG